MSKYTSRFLARVSTIVVFGYLAVTIAQGAVAPPVAKSPGSSTGALVLIGDPCPRFHWESTEDAESYELVVYGIAEDIEDAQVVFRESVPGSESSWAPEVGSCLDRGNLYAWSVRGSRGGLTTDWSEPSFFEVIELETTATKQPVRGNEPNADKAKAKEFIASDRRSPSLGDEAALKGAEEAIRARDYDTALGLLKPLAERGNPQAQNGLGTMYGHDLGAKQDTDESLRWEREAAEKGDPLAQFRLGTLYALGRGVPRDYDEAFDWISKATIQGYPLLFHFEPGWTVGHYAERSNGDWILEIVRQRDDINNWNELLTIQKFDVWWGGATARDSLELLKAERELVCPRATDWNVLSGDSSSVVYEWQTHSCRGWPDQHEVAKIIYGEDMRIRIAYSVKAYRILSSQRDDWVEKISEAAVETRRR